MVRIFLLGAVAVVACVYALVRAYTRPAAPMLVPRPAAPVPTELPAPELVPLGK